MDGRDRTFLLLQVFFCFFIFASTEETKQNCSQVQCPGPLTYYHDMGCTPVYRNQGDCCAYKYNCDHLDIRSPNKCYIQNRSYEIGEYVNQEDIGLCNITCLCVAGKDSSHFACSHSRDYVDRFSDDFCYMKRNIHECGPGTLMCFTNESDYPRCVVDGYKYMAGQYFIPKNEPRKLCICQEDYTGDNNEQFCTTMNITCSPEFYLNEEIAKKNAPILKPFRLILNTESPAIYCTVSWLSQNAIYTLIPNPNRPNASKEISSGGEEDLTCKVGNLTMDIGDELCHYTDHYSDWVKCVCEVPPTPTCRYAYYNFCSSVGKSVTSDTSWFRGGSTWRANLLIFGILATLKCLCTPNCFLLLLLD